MLTPLPRREPLVAQTVQILRSDLFRGEWIDRLPGERALCERLQISRPTLRAALAVLRRQGLIRTVARGGHLVCRRHRPARERRGTPTIGMLMPAPPDLLSPSGLAVFRDVERYLHAAGYEVEQHYDPRLRGGGVARRLTELTERHRVACWLLCTVPRGAQRWFMEQRVPVLVAGTCFPGIDLPWMDVDYRAVCRHAAQTLLSLGHRRIALLSAVAGAGDLCGDRGFREAFEQSGHADARPIVLEHAGTVAAVRRLLDGQFQGRTPPTALVVAHARHALTAASYLVQRGLRLPADVSIISRDNDDLLACFVPALARYVYDWRAHSRRLARALVQLARAGSLAPRHAQEMPQLVKGETLGPAP